LYRHHVAHLLLNRQQHHAVPDAVLLQHVPEQPRKVSAAMLMHQSFVKQE
jgi:hypothetical protein